MTDPVRLTGDESFTDIDATVRDFWAYSLSNLKENAARGYLAEFLVAKAVGAAGPRIEWDAYDVLSPDGITIEVKTSGHAQTWERRGPVVLKFGGLPGGREGTKVKRSWSAATGGMIDAFVANVYVFCVQTTIAERPYDGLDIGAWDFYVLPGRVVAGTGQKSMVLSTVIRLGGECLAWHDLAAEIRAVAEVNNWDQSGGAVAPEEKRDEMSEDLCIHDMAPGTCALCSPRYGGASASMLADTAVVYVSPSHVGHLAGCLHKDDEDFSRWGEITRPGAWQDLRNGRAVATDSGARVGLVANEACKSCIARS
ncbi:hypothetical protein ACFQ80_07015 [Isoptericola sp. NPDC056578]|uniref:hypothetical protein n=1 Tax=Isoptericola sp. NPDC056578 TaxID=3345870 RepID=UPI00368F7265